FGEAGEIASVELPDSAWRGRKRRGPSTQPYIPFGFAQGRSAFGRDDRVRGPSGKTAATVKKLAGHASLQRSRSLTRVSVSAGTNPVRVQCMENCSLVSTGRAGFGMACREGESGKSNPFWR